MGKPETIQEYLTAMEEQIRWKRAVRRRTRSGWR